MYLFFFPGYTSWGGIPAPERSSSHERKKESGSPAGKAHEQGYEHYQRSVFKDGSPGQLDRRTGKSRRTACSGCGRSLTVFLYKSSPEMHSISGLLFLFLIAYARFKSPIPMGYGPVCTPMVAPIWYTSNASNPHSSLSIASILSRNTLASSMS